MGKHKRSAMPMVRLRKRTADFDDYYSDEQQEQEGEDDFLDAGDFFEMMTRYLYFYFFCTYYLGKR